MLLCLGGSLRDGSLSSGLLRLAREFAWEVGSEADILTPRDLSSLLEPGITRPEDSGPARLGAAVQAADSVLVVTPIYGGTPSGAVKNLLDTLHLFKDEDAGIGALTGRRVVVGAVGGGAVAGEYTFQPGATVTLEIACQNLGAWVSPRHLEFSELMFDTMGHLVDPLGRDALRVAVNSLVASRAVAL